MTRRPFDRRRTSRPLDDREDRGLSRRATRVLVIAGAILILILAYLSAVILIEGARNPDELPQDRPSEVSPPPNDAHL